MQGSMWSPEDEVSTRANEVSAPAPQPPQPIEPPADWPHRELYCALHKALFALPSFFKTDLLISGVAATDLFTFNSSLGATIEGQVVRALNAMRTIWDPDKKYSLYQFVRQAQRFPDVILRASTPDTEPFIIMGIELKGWYVLAKEQEPSFRYRVTPAVCAPQDLLVIYPWALDNVLSGSPKLFEPYIVNARHAAEYRNWYWQYKKEDKGSSNDLTLSSVNRYYPAKGDKISDIPKSDSGGNFGRLARTNIMDDYRKMLFREDLSGIPLFAWQKFFSLFKEEEPGEKEIVHALKQIISEFPEKRDLLSEEVISGIKASLIQIITLLEPG